MCYKNVKIAKICILKHFRSNNGKKEKMLSFSTSTVFLEKMGQNANFTSTKVEFGTPKTQKRAKMNFAMTITDFSAQEYRELTLYTKLEKKSYKPLFGAILSSNELILPIFGKNRANSSIPKIQLYN